MPSSASSLEFPNTDEAITLVVGWVTNKKTKLRQVTIGGDVEAAFRDVLVNAIVDLGNRESAPWTPDADMSPETFLTISTDDLGDAPALAAEHGDDTLFQALGAAEALDILHPADLPAGDLSFYAIVLGNVAGERSVFLRRSNPRRGLKRGRIYSLLSDSLQRIEEPIFAFDEWVDLIGVNGNLYVLSQSVFAALFRDQDALAARIPLWSQELNAALPVHAEGLQRLVDRALRDSRLRARLEAIVRRGHLSAIPIAQVKAAMVASGLDADALINSNGQLILEDGDIPEVLYFLNEDLFVGSLSSTGFRADKKAAR